MKLNLELNFSWCSVIAVYALGLICMCAHQWYLYTLLCRCLVPDEHIRSNLMIENTLPTYFRIK